MDARWRDDERRHDLGVSWASAAAEDAGHDRDENETADADGEADYEGLVAVDPGFDLFAEGGAFAAALMFIHVLVGRGLVEREMEGKLTL